MIAIVDATGTAVVSYTYDAWGNILSVTGTMADTLGKSNPLRYRGYVYDPETELYYLQSRYYDPEVGRFINADAFTSTGQGILGNNMFAYCNNCPVKYKDSDGHELVTATAVVIVIEAVLIVATVAIISCCVATLLGELSGWIADSLHQITWANIEYAKEVAEPEPPDVTYPGDDPQKEPN